MNEKRTPGSPTQKSSTLNPKIAGLLAYLFGWLGGLIILLIEKDNKDVRFHALQSIAFNVVIFAFFLIFVPVSIVLGEIIYSANKVLGLIIGAPITILGWVLQLGTLFFWILLMIKAYNEEHYKLPIIGDKVEKYVNR